MEAQLWDLIASGLLLGEMYAIIHSARILFLWSLMINDGPSTALHKKGLRRQSFYIFPLVIVDQTAQIELTLTLLKTSSNSLR